MPGWWDVDLLVGGGRGGILGEEGSERAGSMDGWRGKGSDKGEPGGRGRGLTQVGVTLA